MVVLADGTLSRLRDCVRPVVVVAHAGVNRVLLCRLLGMPLANPFRLEQGYGCCNVVHALKDGYRVEGINICSDLHDMFLDK
jgi:probable phosphoglycerate mutase